MATTTSIGAGKGIAPIKPKSLYDALVPYEWVFLQMNGDANDTVTQAYDRAYGTAGQSTAIFVSGLTTFIDGNPDWSTNVGYWTPDGANYQRVSTEATRAFCDLSTLSNGGMLIMFRLVMTDPTPSGTEYLISHSDLEAATGGWSISLNTAGDLYIYVKQAGAAGANICNHPTNLVTNVASTYCIYIDCKNDDGYVFKDTIAGNQSTNSFNTSLPICNVTKGVAIGARSGALANNKLGQNGSGGRISNLLMVRCTDDRAADVATIAQQFHASPGDVPLKLVEAYV